MIDVEDRVSKMGSCYEGFLLQSATCTHFAGSYITNYNVKIFRHEGGMFDTSSDKSIVREAKEKWEHAAFNFDRGMKKEMGRPKLGTI